MNLLNQLNSRSKQRNYISSDTEYSNPLVLIQPNMNSSNSKNNNNLSNNKNIYTLHSLPDNNSNNINNNNGTISNIISFFTRYSLWIFEWILVIILVVIELMITLFINSRHRFIYSITDFDINFPYNRSTVSTGVLIVLSVVLPFLIISVIHFYDYRRSVDSDIKYTLKCRYHTVIRLFCLAIITTVLLTDAVKKMVGRPRPNFVQYAGYTVNNAGLVSYTASTGTVNDAYSSFISGHSSLAFAGLLYLSQSLAERFRHQSTRVIEFLCWLPIILAGWIALTRIIDYWHFFEDCIGGAILGIAVSLFYYPKPFASTPFYDINEISSDQIGLVNMNTKHEENNLNIHINTDKNPNNISTGEILLDEVV